MGTWAENCVPPEVYIARIVGSNVIVTVDARLFNWVPACWLYRLRLGKTYTEAGLLVLFAWACKGHRRRLCAYHVQVHVVKTRDEFLAPVRPVGICRFLYGKARTAQGTGRFSELILCTGKDKTRRHD